MADWILPKEVNLPQTGDLDPHHGVKIIDEDSPTALRAAINLYLLSLESSLLPRFYLYDIQVQHYIQDAAPKEDRYLAMIRLMSFGPFNAP